MNSDALLTAAEASQLLPVSRHLIGMWKTLGHLTPAGRRGRSPLYRWGDLIRVERDMRRSPHSHRRTAAA